MFYFSHIESGYDFVAQADSVASARELLIGRIKENIGDDAAELLAWAPAALPLGQFHYPACIEIFTECDPKASRAARAEWHALMNMAEECLRLRETAGLVSALEAVRAAVGAWKLDPVADAPAVKLRATVLHFVHVVTGQDNELRAANDRLAGELDAEAQRYERLRAALLGVTPSHRAPGCWCGHAQDIENYGHEPGCASARALLAAGGSPEAKS